jgi:hypothetical protein
MRCAYATLCLVLVFCCCHSYALQILANIIRPQEPHPDLLGSLLQESGKKHACRMVMSLVIYIALLFMFVWAPARIAAVSAHAFQLNCYIVQCSTLGSSLFSSFIDSS